jgi:hypothetical protein
MIDELIAGWKEADGGNWGLKSNLTLTICVMTKRDF